MINIKISENEEQNGYDWTITNGEEIICTGFSGDLKQIFILCQKEVNNIKK